MNDYTILKNLNDLDGESKALLEKAKEALPNAYAPYSNFHVAAAILLSDGIGCNRYESGKCGLSLGHVCRTCCVVYGLLPASG